MFDLARARSTTAQATQTGHSLSFCFPLGMPCVAMSKAWFIMDCIWGAS